MEMYLSWLFSFIQIAVIFGIVSLGVAYMTYMERKILAFMQVRLGPRRVGWHGILQPIADGMKLFLKEDLIPKNADKWVFIASPIMVLLVAFVSFAAVPFGPPEIEIGGDIAFKPWIIADVNLGIMLVLAIGSLSVYGIILGGWSSNSKYSLLGGLRSASQMISYEVPLALSVIGPLMLAGSLKLGDIVAAQGGGYFGVIPKWFVIPQLLAFFVFTVSAIAETNRAPFDLPEAESELVAGFHTEYSGMKFAYYFLGEYAAMILASMLAALVYLGGWQPLPFMGGINESVIGMLAGIPFVGTFLTGLVPFGWLFAKIMIFLYGFLWMRATFPRYRYDQLMSIGWKILIPLALLNIVLTGVVISWSEISSVIFG